MRRTVVLLSLLATSCAWSQTKAPPQPQTSRPAFVSGRTERAHTPTYADVYCAGFITERLIQSGLFVLSGEEGGLKNEYSDRDIVYLSRQQGYAVNPGSEFILIRPVYDPVQAEIYQGQNALVKSRGRLYEETGRVRVEIVNEKIAVAKVMHTCSDIVAGDVAIPYTPKPTPQLKPATEPFDRFAPSSGKTHGMIMIAKNFQTQLGAGDTVYLDIGANDGVAPGQFYRVFRTFVSASKSANRRYLQNVPPQPGAQRKSYQLTPSERESLPRDVLGELVILWAEGRSAVGLITRSRVDIVVGDEVELQ